MELILKLSLWRRRLSRQTRLYMREVLLLRMRRRDETMRVGVAWVKWGV
jgi:hypothetical protein